MSIQHFLLHPASGDFWHVDDPVAWCLENALQPLLERASDRLLTLSTHDADRITTVVSRRTGIHFIELRPDQATVHYWVRLADLRPFSKKHGLALKSVKVFLREQKHGVIVLTNGADEFMYGLPLRLAFPVEIYRAKHDHREIEEPDDGDLAPGSWSSYSWDGSDARTIPWAALKSIWRRERPPVCLNCDGPTLTFGFGWRSSMLNKYPLVLRLCLSCRCYFENADLWEMDAWLKANLDERTLPRFERRWNGLHPWLPTP
jgi:hypothetical protein